MSILEAFQDTLKGLERHVADFLIEATPEQINAVIQYDMLDLLENRPVNKDGED